MIGIDPSNFVVISQDDYGKSVRCSFCTHAVPRVVILPLTQRSAMEDRIHATDGEGLWVGICAGCVLAMSQAFVQNGNEVS